MSRTMLMPQPLRLRHRCAVAGAGFRRFVAAGVGWVDGPCRPHAAAFETIVHGDVAVTAARLGVGNILEAYVTLKRLASAEVLLHKALKKHLNNKQTQTTTTNNNDNNNNNRPSWPAGSVINLLIKTHKTLGMEHS